MQRAVAGFLCPLDKRSHALLASGEESLAVCREALGLSEIDPQAVLNALMRAVDLVEKQKARNVQLFQLAQDQHLVGAELDLGLGQLRFRLRFGHDSATRKSCDLTLAQLSASKCNRDRKSVV